MSKQMDTDSHGLDSNRFEEDEDYEQIDGEVEEEEDEAPDSTQESITNLDRPDPSMGGGFTKDFQQLLQLASHLKSAQPEVREKRAKWDRLKFFEKNSVIFQDKDAEIRFAGCRKLNSTTAATTSPITDDDSFETVRFPRALQWKIEASDLFKSGAYGQATLHYQRCVALFQFARKFQTKDGDEIEWYDLLDQTRSTKTPDSTPADAASSPVTVADLAANTPLQIVLPQLTPSQHTRAQQLVFTCLVNIAACEEKLQQWHQVIEVCEAALDIHFTQQQKQEDLSSATTASPSSATTTATPFPLTQLTVKALFRCAMAYNKLDELEKAIAFLQRASRLSPKDELISKELASLKQAAIIQQAKDKSSFGGMFERGEIIFDEEELKKSSFEPKTASTAHSTPAPSPASTGSSMNDPSSLPPAAVDQTKQFMEEYLNGFREQAELDRKKKAATSTASISTSSTTTAASTKKPTTAPSTSSKSHDSALKKDDEDEEYDGFIDTSAASRSFPFPSASGAQPSPASLAAMYADARANFGLDLSDPLIQEELRRLQEEHRRTGKTLSEREKEMKAEGNRFQSKKTTPAGAIPTDVPKDLSQCDWFGPFLFFILLAIALRWMHIL